MFTTINSFELCRFGTWAPLFYLNNGYKKSVNKNNKELLIEADILLKNLSDYELNNMYSFVIRLTVDEFFGGPRNEDTGFVMKTKAELEGNYAISSIISIRVEKKLWRSIERRSIFMSTQNSYERLQLSILIIWLKGIMKSPHRIKKAIEKRKKLLIQLAEINQYIDN